MSRDARVDELCHRVRNGHLTLRHSLQSTIKTLQEAIERLEYDMQALEILLAKTKDD